MDFLYQYGLFLSKSVTILVVFLVAVGGVLLMRRQGKPRLEIESLNEVFEGIQAEMLQVVKHDKPPKRSRKAKKALRQRPAIYVIDFCGDIKASEVEGLRTAVTAVLSVVSPKDEVVVRIDSPGGSVNAYGLAASQLQRIRDKGIRLTACIDKIAASGGYLMACVAHEIIAAPFAIIGSIGVVAQLPNFHRWLKRNDIDIELLTAGEYKRTLTVLGENTEKGRQKFQEDLESIHHAFKESLIKNRPQLDLAEIATGEHWLASEGFNKRLIDSIKTSDDYLMEKMTEFNLFKLSAPIPRSVVSKMLKPVARLMHPWG